MTIKELIDHLNQFAGVDDEEVHFDIRISVGKEFAIEITGQ